MRARYGATPLHLLAHLAAFALAGFAILQLVDVRRADNLLLWFLGAIVLHDFALLPLYSVLDRAPQRLAGRAVNYVRIPAGLSALLLLVFFPVICGRSDGAFRFVSGVELEGYLGRWLMASALLFAASAALFALRTRPRRASRSPSS